MYIARWGGWGWSAEEGRHCKRGVHGCGGRRRGVGEMAGYIASVPLEWLLSEQKRRHSRLPPRATRTSRVDPAAGHISLPPHPAMRRATHARKDGGEESENPQPRGTAAPLRARATPRQTAAETKKKTRNGGKSTPRAAARVPPYHPTHPHRADVTGRAPHHHNNPGGRVPCRRRSTNRRGGGATHPPHASGRRDRRPTPAPPPAPSHLLAELAERLLERPLRGGGLPPPPAPRRRR